MNPLQSVPSQVILRDVVESDLPIFYAHQLDPEATTMAAFPSRNEADFMAHWHKILRDPANINQTILFDNHVAGNIACFPIEGEREIGYWIGKEYWGRGITTHALRAFLTQLPMRPLYAHVVKHNIASRRVLEKCGFVVTGEDSYAPPGGTFVEEFTLKLD
jgi:RimJ/RimL family protein N-acetyltransferase